MLQERVGFGELYRIEREKVRGQSRLDLLAYGPYGRIWIEAKSVTLVRDGVAMFPDAPTLRGTKHVDELADIVRQGERSALAFIVQRNDAYSLTPNRGSDPDFADALGRAARQGVELRAYTCQVSLAEVTLYREIPVVLHQGGDGEHRTTASAKSEFREP